MFGSLSVTTESLRSAITKPQVLVLALPGGLVVMEAMWAAKLALPLAADRLEGPARVGALIVLILILATAVWTALSWVWLSFDRYFFSNPGWIAHPARGVSVVTPALLYTLGWAFITWVALLALGPRLGGPEQFQAELLWPLVEMPRAYALIVAATTLVFLPLALRVGLACVVGACEPKEAPTAQLKRLSQTTRRKGPQLLLPILCLSPLVALLVWSAAQALGASSPLTALPMSALFAAALVPVAAVQVSIARHFYGISKFGEEFQTRDIVAPSTSYSDTNQMPTMEQVPAAGVRGDEESLSEDTIPMAKFEEGAPAGAGAPPAPAAPAAPASAQLPDAPPPVAAPLPSFDAPAAGADPPPAPAAPAAPASAQLPDAPLPSFDAPAAGPPPPPAAAPAEPLSASENPSPPPPSPQVPAPAPSAPDPSEGDIPGSEETPSWADGLWEDEDAPPPPPKFD